MTDSTQMAPKASVSTVVAQPGVAAAGSPAGRGRSTVDGMLLRGLPAVGEERVLSPPRSRAGTAFPVRTGDNPLPHTATDTPMNPALQQDLARLLLRVTRSEER